MTLYELTSDYVLLLQMAQEDDVDEQCLCDTLLGIDGAFEEKAENYAKVLKSIDDDVDAISAEIKRLQDRKKSLENAQERMKQSLKMAMETTGKTKFKTPLFSFGIQKNPPSLQIADGAVIPDEYLIEQEPKVDKKAIIEDIKGGMKCKWAQLVQTERLSIR